MTTPTATESAERLAPCPFCGGEVTGDKEWFTHPLGDCFFSGWEFDRAGEQWNQRAQSPVVATEQLLMPDDLTALKRIAECFEDGEGYDVPKFHMARLAEIGTVQSKGFGRYQITSFGDYVLGTVGGADFKLPLKTLDEYNRDAAIAAQEEKIK